VIAKRSLLICCLVAGACAARKVAVELPGAPPPLGPRELEPWRRPPAPAPDVVRRLPLDVRRIALDNGMHVTVVPRPGTATTAIALHVPSMRDASDGPVAVMAEALRAGTHQAAGEMLINPKLGAPIQIGTSNAGTVFSWEVLPRASALAVRLLAAFLLSPTFNPPDVTVQLRQALGRIERHSGSSDHMHDIVHAAFPGLKSPTPEDDAKGLIKLTPAILRQVHACTVRPEGAELVVVGPVTFEEVAAWAKVGLGGWRAMRPSADPSCAEWLRPQAPLHPEQARLSRTQLQIVYGEFDPVMIVSVPGPDPTSEDYLAFSLLTEIVAARGAGASRALRDMGATYGVNGSLYDGYAGLSLFDLFGQIDPEVSQNALRSLVADIRTVAKTLGPNEFNPVARHWRNEVVNSLGSNTAVASWVFWQLRRKREASALPELLGEIARIDVARCRDVAERWLSSAQPSIGVMGLPGRFVDGLGLDVHVTKFYWTNSNPRASR